MKRYLSLLLALLTLALCACGGETPPPQPAVRKISSEPPRMGRLVAFADGRRSRRKRPQGR